MDEIARPLDAAVDVMKVAEGVKSKRSGGGGRRRVGGSVALVGELKCYILTFDR